MSKITKGIFNLMYLDVAGTGLYAKVYGANMPNFSPPKAFLVNLYKESNKVSLTLDKPTAPIRYITVVRSSYGWMELCEFWVDGIKAHRKIIAFCIAYAVICVFLQSCQLIRELE